MGHLLGALLLAALSAGLALHMVDLLFTIPAAIRAGLSLVLAAPAAFYLQPSLSDVLLLTGAAAMLANVLVAVLQLLQIQRDAAVVRAFSRVRR